MNCTCETAGICGACRHNPIPQHLALGHSKYPPFAPCHPSRGQWVGNIQAGTCDRCRDQNTWRLRCSACNYRTFWVEDGWASDDAYRAFAEHHVTAWKAVWV